MKDDDDSGCFSLHAVISEQRTSCDNSVRRLVVKTHDDNLLTMPAFGNVYPIIAKMTEADFTAGKMVMRAVGPYYARAGKWLLIPLEKWAEPEPLENPRYGFLARLFGAPPDVKL